MVCPVPRSGRHGFVGDYTGAVLTRFARVKNWTLNSTATPEVRYYSGTRFGPQLIPNSVDITGSFEGFGASPPVFAGDSFTFIGYTAPTNGVPCTPGCAYTLPAIVESLTITWNWTSEARGVMWSANFVGNGPVTTLPAFDDPCDDDVFCDANPCALELILIDPCSTPADEVTEWCNLITATLTFTATLQQFSNSSTLCLINRTVGNLNWTLDVVDQNPCVIPTQQKDYWITIDASASTFWLLKYAMNLGPSNFRVDMETGDLISKSNLFSMQGVLCCPPAAAPVRGQIITPGGTTVWPYPDPV